MSSTKRLIEEEMEQGNDLLSAGGPDDSDIDYNRKRYEHSTPQQVAPVAPKKINYKSDCHLAPVTNLNAEREKGICTQCGQECWACDPVMLKPISFEQLKKSVEERERRNNANS